MQRGRGLGGDRRGGQSVLGEAWRAQHVYVVFGLWQGESLGHCMSSPSDAEEGTQVHEGNGAHWRARSWREYFPHCESNSDRDGQRTHLHE